MGMLVGLLVGFGHAGVGGVVESLTSLGRGEEVAPGRRAFLAKIVLEHLHRLDAQLVDTVRDVEFTLLARVHVLVSGHLSGDSGAASRAVNPHT